MIVYRLHGAMTRIRHPSDDSTLLDARLQRRVHVENEPLASYRASIRCATLEDVFRYLVKFPDGLLHDPGVFVSAVPFWRLADTLRVGNGQLLRILAVNTRIDHSLLEAGIHGVFTVEVVR